MHQIIKANATHAKLLAKLSKTSFLPAHGHSASKEDIEAYITANFSEENFIRELENPENEYYVMYNAGTIIGYSKIVFNQACSVLSAKNTTYMSRLYLLKEWYGLGLGKKLFDFNRALCRQNNQQGIWLKVWTENQKAIQFYNKMGFVIIGKSDFRISETHSNPNHIMHLEF